MQVFHDALGKVVEFNGESRLFDNPFIDFER